ncbi:MAG: hypothetical protein RID09_11585 [Coleofasciculus sp. G1-WW12-02]|uniref:hypothetical protein n=1 Tax=Coleofasciculus sp. G1-WW12-02 TaxID=3068483 RepID=UPI0032FD7397
MSGVTKRRQRRRVQKKSSANGCLVAFGAIAALIATGAIVTGGIWLGIRLMIDPNAAIWLNRILPGWTKIPIADASPPQTLAKIRDELRQNGLIAGELVSLNTGETYRETPILLPILKSQPNCQTNCQKIVELRLYQPVEFQKTDLAYQLVTQLAINEPEEYFVLSSTDAINGSASRSLAFTQFNRLENKAPATGFWFNLWGVRLTDESPKTYGQILHYNPEQIHLSVLLEWQSPTDSPPYWQQVTGESTPELVINQTVGLEPKFQVYQVQPRQFLLNPIQLTEISLNTFASDSPTYRNSLMLARNGLWSLAYRRLQQDEKNNESATVQAQLDVIRLHAQFTEAQANQTWASQGQQVLAYLIDGRWTDALQVFQTAALNGSAQDIANLLKTDTEGLWRRVEAALNISPNDRTVKTWGALILAAQEGRAKAISWLQQLPPPESESDQPQLDNDAQIYAYLDSMDVALAQAPPIIPHLSQILGTAQSIETVKPEDWRQPEVGNGTATFPVSFTAQSSIPNPQSLVLQKAPQQVWYQIEVAAFNDGQRWRQTPFRDLQLPTVAPTQRLWQYLGLDTDPRLQIAVWSAEGRQETIVATVQAVSYREGVIQLLAAGVALPSPENSRPMAYSQTALRWLEPGSISLSDLNQLQPQWVAAILPTLWQELVKSGKRSPEVEPTIPMMLQEIGHWLVQPLDLTGNNEPEAVLTLYEDLSSTSQTLNIKRPETNTQQYKPRTLIFSEKGALLYSEFSTHGSTSLTAIADLGDGGTAALVLAGENKYSLKRWSDQRKSFE